MVAFFTQLTLLLEQHGPWFLVVAFGSAIALMARYIVRLNAEHRAEISAVMAAQRQDTREVIEALVMAGQSIDSMRTTFVTVLEARDDQKRLP